MNYTSGEILKSLFIKGYDDEILKAILWDIRIPRILIAVMEVQFVSGRSIASGCNEKSMAGPGLTGVSSGASVTALIIMILYPKAIIFMNFFCIVGGSIACAVVFMLAWKKGLKPIRVILSRCSYKCILGSITGLMFILFSDEIQGDSIVAQWKLNGKNWRM